MSQTEINRKLDLHTRLLARLLCLTGDTSMALSADVQKLIDGVAQNRNLALANGQALQIQEKQIADLKAQLAGIQPGQPIDAEDLTAIQKAVTDLADTNTQLQSAVPANVNTGGVDANGNPVTPGTPSQDPGNGNSTPTPATPSA
jgi:hypothetical protein